MSTPMYELKVICCGGNLSLRINPAGDALARTITNVVDQVMTSFEITKDWDPVASAALDHAIVQVVQVRSRCTYSFAVSTV